jgi:V/A-type H+-transporting ATPase subunit B
MAEVEYESVFRIRGPLIFAGKVSDVGFGDVVRIKVRDGDERLGQVIEIRKEFSIIQVFEGTMGIDKSSSIIFSGEPMKFPVTSDMVGRILDGKGAPIDGGPRLTSELRIEVRGAPINPVLRDPPRNFIQTGISAVDGMLTMAQGQKLPIFSGGGLPHNQLAAQLTRQSKVLGSDEQFVVIFSGMGLTHEDADFFIREFRRADILDHSVIFLNRGNDPSGERLLTPRLALTAAEYLAFDLGYHVLVILIDMTNYCEALREISMSREEVPGRRGYPGYLYTDLATIYERAGRIKGKKGSITQIPILSMPDFDITHPIPDLTGFITEGQITLSPILANKGIYPPIDVLPSLSRFMTRATGLGKTGDDHMGIANKLYSTYARGREMRELVLVIGKESLSSNERRVLQFAEEFETKFIAQDPYEERKIEDTLKLGQELLSNIE